MSWGFSYVFLFLVFGDLLFGIVFFDDVVLFHLAVWGMYYVLLPIGNYCFIGSDSAVTI